MNIVFAFKDYLFSQRNKPSHVTVKNYLSDVRKFITWYEGYTSKAFEPAHLTPEIAKAFEANFINAANGASPAARSAKRYISSLRKFAHFLEQSGAIEANPFKITLPQPKINDDPWELKQFTNKLVNDKASKLTVKNYMIDVKQFLDWLEKVAPVDETIETNRFANITYYTLEQYKSRLLNENRFSPVSINRKLSSLRRYIRWLHDNQLLNNQPEITDISPNKGTTEPVKEEVVDTTVLDLPLTALKSLQQEKVAEKSEYSNFGPLRLAQRTGRAITRGFDSLIINPIISSSEAISYYFWKRSGKKVFAPVKEIMADTPEAASLVAQTTRPENAAIKAVSSRVTNVAANATSLIGRFTKPKTFTQAYEVQNISKAFYAPLKISLREMPWPQRLLHHLRYTRPSWYAKYHSFPIVHQFHFAIMFLAMTIAGISIFYIAFDTKPLTNQALASLPASPPRTIAFQGRLLDKTNTPLTADTSLRFAIYNSPTASKAAMLWQEVQLVQPDNEGNFSVMLGRYHTLTQDIFNSSQNLFVGIAIGGDKELQPRQQLPTVGFASNALSLQGLKAITKTDKTANVLLALDSSGNLTIGGQASPTFQATGGQFTLSGQSLLFTTNPGSNGNVEIVPDGSGIIDLQKPIQNTSNYVSAAGIPGAVGIDDLLAVSATSSTHSALTVKQNGAGDIISGYNNGSAKFKVEATGNTLVGGNLTVEGNTITTNNTSFALFNNSVTDLSIGTATTALSLGGFHGTTTVNNDLTVSGTVRTQKVILANGGLNIGTGQALAIADLAPGSIPFINNLNQLAQDPTGFTWSQNTRSLNITGSLCIRSTTGTCSGSNPGTIYASNATVQAADLAENYVSSDPLEPGDVVMPEGTGNNLAVKKTLSAYQPQVIGIISTKPGFTLNSDASPDRTHPYLYPLALQGRVPLKVSAMNGSIKAGDALTTSSIPGVAMKATKPGQIIAKALEDYDSSDKNAISKIMVFVNISYDAPQSYITDEGNLSLAANIPAPTSNDVKRDNINTFGKPLGTAMNTLLDIEAGFIAVKDITTQTLTVATDNITVNGQHISTYINSIVAKAVDPYVASLQATRNAQPRDNATETKTPDLSLTLPASTSANIKTDAAPIASNAATLPIYNSIASGSAVEEMPIASPASEVKDTPSPIVLPSSSALFKSDLTPPASSAAELGIDKLDAHEASVTKSLNVLGRTTLTDVGITGAVNIGLLSIHGLDTDSRTAETFASINTSIGPLKFQSDGFNGVDFLNGKITINTAGELNVNGNAYFAKNVSIKGTLEANIIAPVPGSDLVVKLDKNSQNSSLNVKNGTGGEILEVNQKGDIAASGSGKFMNLNIVRGVQADTSNTQTVAAGSTGKGIIKANQKERTIITPFVSAQSLIYVTATSDTQRSSLYVARQTPEDPAHGNRGSFTIQVTTASKQDISFNWWIVN